MAAGFTKSDASAYEICCPMGWLGYGGHCYRYFTLKNFNDARNHCKDLGADLVSIHSSIENDIINGLSSGEEVNSIRQRDILQISRPYIISKTSAEGVLHLLSIIMEPLMVHQIKGVASLTIPGGQEFHFAYLSSTFHIFVLTLALRVGESQCGKACLRHFLQRTKNSLDKVILKDLDY